MLVKKTLNIETFTCKVNLIISDTLKKEIAKIYNKYKVPYDNDEVEGIVISGDIGLYYILIDLNCLSHNTIAHEIYHLVVRITEDRYVMDQETQAWLCGYITETIYNFIKLKKLEIK